MLENLYLFFFAEGHCYEFWVMQNYANHAQEYQHSNWLRKSWKIMCETCGCTSQQLENHAKAWKMVMQNHANHAQEYHHCDKKLWKMMYDK